MSSDALRVWSLILVVAATACRDEGAEHEHPAAAGEPAAAPPMAGRDEPAAGHDPHGHDQQAPTGLPPGFRGPGKVELSDPLRALLVAEMVQIESAMHRMLSGLAKGELEAVAADARAVHESFILAQELTPAQRQELHERLPTAFVTLDRQFHGHAAELARRATAADARGAAAIYGQLAASCVTCHQAYARERFPGLSTAEPGDGAAPAPAAPGGTEEPHVH